MAKHFRLWWKVALLLLVAGALADPLCRAVLSGLMTNEPFYRGLPLSYWESRVDPNDPAARETATAVWADVVRHGTPEERNRAGHWLDANGDGGVLVAALRDRDPETRRFAAEWFLMHRVPHRHEVDALAEALRDTEPAVRVCSSWALARAGVRAKSAVPALTEALADPDRIVREHAALALAAVGSEGATAVESLARRLRECSLDGDDARVAIAEALALWRIGRRTDGAAVLARVLARHSDPAMRGAAAAVLEEMGPAATDATSVLRNALTDSDKGVRRAARAALARIDGRSIVGR